MSFKFPSYLLSGILLCATVFSLPACARDIQSIEKLANQGDAKAQYEWGMLLVDGDKVKQDTITGRKWIEKAAAKGDKKAYYFLGNLYKDGNGVQRDYNKSESVTI